MKKLLIIRHAKSSWDSFDLKDFERPLNKKGEKDAPFMGKRLKKFQISPDLIISSPAKRAKKTVKLIAQEIEFPLEKIEYIQNIYEAEVPDLLKILKKIPDSVETLLLCGHNPGLTDLTAFLTGAGIGSLPTCAICGVNFDLDSWSEIDQRTGTLDFFDYPKKHHS